MNKAKAKCSVVKAFIKNQLLANTGIFHSAMQSGTYCT